MPKLFQFALYGALLTTQIPGVPQAEPAQMMQACRIHAGKALKARLPDIDTKYEGQRTDGTHAVNGTASVKGVSDTFQCSFDKSGRKILNFIVNARQGAAGDSPPETAGDGDATVDGSAFNATGEVACARAAGQPMTRCQFGVVRSGGTNGWIKVFWPEGGSRVIFFEDMTPMRYDESKADAGAKMTVGREADLYIVRIGAERFEIPDAVITGG